MYGLEVCRGLDMDAEFLQRAVQIRKQFFSEDGKATVSSYNPTLIVSKCEVCGGKTGLETHHIVPQAVAKENGKTISPGKHMNTKENLVCLCDVCHTEHHMGKLTIVGWDQTTFGKTLRVQRA